MWHYLNFIASYICIASYIKVSSYIAIICEAILVVA